MLASPPEPAMAANATSVNQSKLRQAGRARGSKSHRLLCSTPSCSINSLNCAAIFRRHVVERGVGASTCRRASVIVEFGGLPAVVDRAAHRQHGADSVRVSKIEFARAAASPRPWSAGASRLACTSSLKSFFLASPLTRNSPMIVPRRLLRSFDHVGCRPPSCDGRARSAGRRGSCRPGADNRRSEKSR